MARWRDGLIPDDMDLLGTIDKLLRLAHADHYDELRLKRDQYSEIMYGPRTQKASDGGSVRNPSSDKTNASSGVYKARQAGNGAVEREPQHVQDDEDEDEDEDDEEGAGGEDEGHELLVIEDEDVDGEAPDHFDADMMALEDDIEREKLLMSEIYSIKNTIDSVPAGTCLPDDEALEILERIQELNLSVDALKETKIGKSVIRMSRKHPNEVVKEMAEEMVSSWKVLVDEYLAAIPPVASVSANDDGIPAGEVQVGLASPPLDEDGLVAARSVGITGIQNFFNFSESDLSVASAASGPSPASDDPSVVHHRGRKLSSSPDEELVGREGKGVARQGVARVLKVDKHRPVHTEAKPGEEQRRATHSSGSIRRGPNAPSERAPNQVRSSTPTTSATAKRDELPTRPRGTVRGASGNENRSGGKPSDARTTPSVGAIRPRVETTKPGLATRVAPLPTFPTDSNEIDAAIQQSKRKLHERYASIANAKKQRTVQPLELTELPKGGPKAQRPGQRWVKTK